MKKTFFVLAVFCYCTLAVSAFASNNTIKKCDKTKEVCSYQAEVKNTSSAASSADKVLTSVDQTAKKILTGIAPAKKSTLQDRITKEDTIAENQFAITLYRPTYLLPYYYTASPYTAVYKGNTPDSQPAKSSEVKGQFSFKVPMFRNFLGRGSSLNFAYTQVSYWQLYTRSPYFRETNYEPELFFSDNFFNNWLFNIGVVHQSNGRGGKLERSWNRAYFDLSFSGKHWMISLKPWLLIVQNESSNLHNPDIAHYLGYGRVVLAYKCRGQVVSMMFRNAIFSGFKRGTVELTWSFPLLHSRVRGYVQAFSGYGQSLIEYNHYTNSIGVGIALNDWV